MSCPFCNVSDAMRVGETSLLFALLDKHPVSAKHTLIIPKRHCENFFDLSKDEYSEMLYLLHDLRTRWMLEDDRITGFNMGMNCGESAGQTIMHCHVHLIPRRSRDVSDPRGGVRGVIPHKQSY